MDTIRSEQKSPHVIVSTFKEGVNPQDVEQATGKITAMIDQWNVQGNMIWTGSFNDGKSAMSVLKPMKQTLQHFSIVTTMCANHFLTHTCISGMPCLYCHF